MCYNARVSYTPSGEGVLRGREVRGLSAGRIFTVVVL